MNRRLCTCIAFVVFFIGATVTEAATIRYSVDWVSGTFSNGDPLGLAGAHIHVDALVDPTTLRPFVGPDYTDWGSNDGGAMSVQVTVTGSSYADGTTSGFNYGWHFGNDSAYSTPRFQVDPPVDLVLEGPLEVWPGGYDVTIGGLVFALPASFNTPAPDGTIFPYPFENSALLAQPTVYMDYDFYSPDSGDIISEAHTFNVTAHAEVVPEPASATLFGIAVLGFLARSLRSRLLTNQRFSPRKE